MTDAPFLAGGGEMGALMRSKDWSTSLAGAPENWPDPIKAAVALCLSSMVPIIVWIGTRSENLVQLYNDAYRPVMGADKHPQGLGCRGAVVWPEIWPDIMTPIFDEVLLQGRAVRRDDQRMILYRNGYPEDTVFSHYHSPIHNTGGEIVGVFTVVLEVTEQKRAERALQDLNENLEEQVASRTADRDRMWRLSTDIMLVADFGARIVSVNPAWTALLGWREDEVRGMNFLDLVHPDDVAATVAETQKLKVGLTTMRFENRYRQKEGGFMWLSWTAVPDERFIHAVGRDVTAEKVAAARLEEVQRAFQQAQKMEALGQLTGGIAHDFNNLLQVIAGGLELIRRRPTDVEKVRGWAEASLEATDRGAKLTGQLLAFARAQKLELKAVDVDGLIGRMHEMLSRTLGPDIQVMTAMDGRGICVLADPTQLELAILNLAINSRDAMAHRGDLKIHTRLRRVNTSSDLTAGEYLELSISDSGSGMPPEVLQRALEPFYTTKTVGAGTGLGLSQVYAMASQAGGAVRIESVIGHGTTVRVLLRTTQLLPDPIGHPASPIRENAHPARIMIVDDDSAVRHFLKETLQASGYETFEAESGRAALVGLDTFQPDVAVIDFAMPQRNGADVARDILERAPRTGIVFASGFSDTRAIEEAVGSGAVILRKPFRIEELQDAVEQASWTPTRVAEPKM